MKETERNAVCILVLYLALWYVGSMFGFFPFIANDLAIAAVGFAGLLIVRLIGNNIENKTKLHFGGTAWQSRK